MHELSLVLNAKAQGVLNSTFGGRPGSWMKDLASGLIIGGFVLAMFLLARFGTAYLLSQAHIGHFLFHRFLSMILYILFITVNLGNVIVCYATLYRSEEVRFLMGLPVSHETIFLVKLVDNFLHSSTTLVLMAIAILLGYGSVFAMPWHFYFLMMFGVVLPFLFIAGIVGVIILMVLIKVAARVGIRWLLSLSVGTYLFAAYAYFALTNPVQLVQDVMRNYPDVDGYFEHLTPAFSALLPNHWVAEFLYWSVNGDSARALPHLLTLNGVFLALLLLAALVGRKMYYRSWLAASDARAMRGPEMTFLRGGLLEFGSNRLFSPVTNAFIKRDFWMFVREPGQWLHAILMVFLLGASLVSLEAMGLGSPNRVMQMFSFLGVFLFNGFLIASVALRFVFPSVSLEGETFWCVRTSPMSLRRLYWQKFAGLLVVLVAIAEVQAILSTRMVTDDPQLLLLGVVSAGYIAVTMTSLHLGGGSYFATYKESNAIRVSSSQGASLTFLVSIGYLLFAVGMLWLAMSRYAGSVSAGAPLLDIWRSGPVMLFGILSLAGSAAATWVGLRSFHRDY